MFLVFRSQIKIKTEFGSNFNKKKFLSYAYKQNNWKGHSKLKGESIDKKIIEILKDDQFKRNLEEKFSDFYAFLN